MNLLQLINEPMAASLNYGMFRRKEINGTAKHLMFYDMGAYDTTVSIVAYTVVKSKERGFSESHPQAQILGIGYDRTLGGLHLQIKLRDFLAEKFNELKKPKTDVKKNPRAMGKLFKEAGRVKDVLSANSQIYAQVFWIFFLFCIIVNAIKPYLHLYRSKMSWMTSTLKSRSHAMPF